ncbi:ATPase [Aureococcus anophagefferens]|nr:ATPase [Aureococcus anophagefferens]
MFSFEADRDDESTESGKEPPLLVWENASLTQEAYPTLVNSSGFVEKGEMMAVLGSRSDTGAFADLLSGRPVAGEVAGYFALDGRTARREKLRDSSATVPFGMELPAHLTVLEASFFLLRLRAPADVDNFEVSEALQSIGYLGGDGADDGNPCDLILDLITIDCDKDPRSYGTSTMVYLTDVANASRAFHKTCARRPSPPWRRRRGARGRPRTTFCRRRTARRSASPSPPSRRASCGSTCATRARSPRARRTRASRSASARSSSGHDTPDDLLPWDTVSYADHASTKLSYERVTSYTHACVVWVITILMAELSAVTVTFHDRLRASRDMADGLYGPRVYFVAAAAVEILSGFGLYYPMSLLFAWATGLERVFHFARVMATMGCFFKVGLLSACCVAARLDLAANAVTTAAVVSVCCSNAVIRRRDLPRAFKWMPYFSLLRPALAMLVREELGSDVVAYLGLGDLGLRRGERTNDFTDSVTLQFFCFAALAPGYYWLARTTPRGPHRRGYVKAGPGLADDDGGDDGRGAPDDDEAPLPTGGLGGETVSPREVQIERILAAYEAALLRHDVGYGEIEALRLRTGVVQDESEGVVSPAHTTPFASLPKVAARKSSTPYDPQKTTHRRKISRLMNQAASKSVDDHVQALADFARTYARSDHLPVEVRYREVNYYAMVDTTRPKVENVVNVTPLGVLLSRMMHEGETSKHVDILKGVSGAIKPGTLTLVLGKPGAGKTSFLKMLCGMLKSSAARDLTFEGDCFYNGEPLSDPKGRFVPSKVAAYIDQIDLHSASLTVEDTLEFAYETLGAGEASGGAREDLAASLRGVDATEVKDFIKYQKEGKMKLHTVLGILGLAHVKGTIVGNATTRGISGGQRRRVSVGEILMGKARVLCGDSITTGLDSQTAHEIVKAFKCFARDLKTTCVLSLLQPPPEVFLQFDSVCLLDAGRVIYHGPTQGILDHFASIGFRPPARKDAADFLIEVSSPAGYAFYEGYATPPASADAFAALFRQTEWHAQTVDALDSPNAYALGDDQWPARAFEIAKDTTFVKVKCFQALAMGLATGLLFRDLGYEDFTSKMGLLFAVLMYLGVTGLAYMPELLERRDVFYKMRDQSFFPTLAFTLANVAVDLPIAVIESAIFTNVAYWFTGLGSQGYPLFFAICLTLSVSMASIFALIASVAPNEDVANPMAGALIVCFVLFSGFIVQRPNIPWFWKWLYWMSPIAHGIRAAAINEFGSERYASCKFQTAVAPFWYFDWEAFRWRLYADGCAFADSDGHLFLKMYEFQTDRSWIGGAFVVFGAYFAAGMVFQTVALSVVRVGAGPTSGDGEEPEPLERHPSRVHSLKPAEATPVDDVADPFLLPPEKAPPAPLRVESDDDCSPRHDAAPPGTPRRRYSEKKLAKTASRRSERKQSAFSAANAGDIDASGDVPYEPMSVAFRDLHYFVDVPSKKGGGQPEHLELLAGVTGFATPGTMTALMGSSGAGKTTLLDVVAGRKTGGSLSGMITVNGHAKKQDTFARVSGYVEQLDVHSPGPTVAEAVAFSAALRLNPSADEKRKPFCANILRILELAPIADNQVGTLGKPGGLSFEQRKRLTIAVELAANPAIFFLDEPTSGLDSRAALVVIRAVRQVAVTGRSVICTVHQPSYALFAQFDRLLLLKKGGMVVYFGGLGEDSGDLVAFLSQTAASLGPRGPDLDPLRPGANPATWMLGACTDAVAEAYGASALHDENVRLCETLMRPAEGSLPVSFPTKYAVNMSRQRAVLVQRMIINYWRGPAYNLSRGAVSFLISLLFGTVFTQERPDAINTFTGGLGRIGLLYISTLFMGIIFFVSAVPQMMEERKAYYREKQSKMYSTLPYTESFGVAEFPYLLGFSLLHTATMWVMVDFYPGWDKYAWYFAMYFLYVSGMTFLAQFLVAAMPSQEAATSLGTAFLSVCSIVAGFAISPTKIPWYFKPLYHVATIHYALEGMVVTQFHDSHVRISDLPGWPTDKRDYASHWTESKFGGAFCYSHRWFDVAALVAFMIVFRIGTLICLARVEYTTR